MIIIKSESRVHEYPSPIKLDGVAGNLFAIPSYLILDTEADVKRVSTYSFFSIRRGLDNKVIFSINNIVQWLGKKPNRNLTGINNVLSQLISYLKEKNILLSSEIDSDKWDYTEYTFNLPKILQDCNKYYSYAIVYVDELNTILKYKNPNTKDVYLDNSVVLLVFAYLRLKISRRVNTFYYEEAADTEHDYNSKIRLRRENYPEAYNCYYSDIANDLGISDRTVSKAVDVLNKLGLIYSEVIPRSKYHTSDGTKWRTNHTIFCNTYKREGSYLLDSGSNYYLTELENKKKKMKI